VVVVPPTNICVKKSDIHGLGVFATEIIYPNQIIEFCPIIDMGLVKEEPSPILIDYRFNWPQGNDWEKQVVAIGYAMIYNHSNTPNASWRSNLESKVFEFYAIKTIQPNEEIFIYYGDTDYWLDGRINTVVV
jgi:SET domain-containing protein